MKKRYITDVCGRQVTNGNSSGRVATEEWRPSCSHSYRACGFDLSALALGWNRAVDGRRVVCTGALSRFASDLVRIVSLKSWEDLNRLIARRWREFPHTGTGVFRLELPEVSRPGRLAVIRLKVELGSDLPFADRTLQELSAF